MNKEIRIDIGKFFNALRKKISVIICVAAVSLAIVSVVSEFVIKREYAASTTVYSMSYASLSDSLSGSNALSAYANLVKSRKVAENAMIYIPSEYEITVDQIMHMITVSTTASNNSKLSENLTITAHSENARKAIIVANAVANAFVNDMQSVTGANNIQVLDAAQSAYVSNANAKVIVRIVGAFIGCIIPIIVIFFKEIFSDVVYRIDDATCEGELELLAVIPSFDNMRGNQ